MSGGSWNYPTPRLADSVRDIRADVRDLAGRFQVGDAERVVARELTGIAGLLTIVHDKLCQLDHIFRTVDRVDSGDDGAERLDDAIREWREKGLGT